MRLWVCNRHVQLSLVIVDRYDIENESVDVIVYRTMGQSSTRFCHINILVQNTFRIVDNMIVGWKYLHAP